MLLKQKKNFEDGELDKGAMLSVVESLFTGSGNKAEVMSSIKNVQLSANTITRAQ
jgi:hypothetical protein